MPIYEFYCPDCHVVFSFLAASADTRRRPACPRCERPELTRQLSRFATPRHGGEASGDEADGLPEGAMERAMTELTRSAASMNEDDPREAVHLMRRLTEVTGLPVGEGMREAMRRIEAGEDPEEVEDSLGDLLDAEDPLATASAGPSRTPKRRPPERDEQLYRL